jgi:hypothetical protein
MSLNDKIEDRIFFDGNAFIKVTKEKKSDGNYIITAFLLETDEQKNDAEKIIKEHNKRINKNHTNNENTRRKIL